MWWRVAGSLCYHFSPPNVFPALICFVVSSLYVKLALHLCIIYLRGCGPHWRFYKWHIIPLCLTFIFKEVCFNGRAVRRPVSPWLAAAQQHADARRHSAESQSADSYRKGASSIPGGCRLGARHAGYQWGFFFLDGWVQWILAKFYFGGIGNYFSSLPVFIFNWAFFNNNEDFISQLFPVTFSQSVCSQFLMMLKPSYRTPARMKVKGELYIYMEKFQVFPSSYTYQVDTHPSL